MKLEVKIGKKKYYFMQTKRNVKVWEVDGKPVMKEWNLDEREPVLTSSGRKLIYFAEFWNGVLEYVNAANVKVQ